MVAFRWWTSGLAGGRALTWALLLCGSSVSVPALAQNNVSSEDACTKDDNCREHYAKAVQLYKQEYFEDALTEFKAAYDARQMPLLLVNIGRTMQKLGRPREAVAYYERFQKADSRPDPDTAKRVQQYLEECRALIDDAMPGSARASGPPPPPPQPGKPLLIAGAVIAGVGLGGIIAGGVLGAQASSAFTDYSNSTDEYQKLGFRSTTQSLQIGADVAGIGGAVLLGTGGTLVALGILKNRAALAEHSSKGAKPAKAASLYLPSVSVGTNGFFGSLRGGF